MVVAILFPIRGERNQGILVALAPIQQAEQVATLPLTPGGPGPATLTGSQEEVGILSPILGGPRPATLTGSQIFLMPAPERRVLALKQPQGSGNLPQKYWKERGWLWRHGRGRGKRIR